jgi:SET domain-containing protein
VIVVRQTPGKGRGVFAATRIAEGCVIEEAPVVVVPNHELPHLDQIALQDYYFLWGPDHEHAAIALGVCSLCNHAAIPNCDYIRRYDAETIWLVALRDIAEGEELTINYNGSEGSERPLWFEIKP